jgi:2'-5' RNA ligase
MVDPVGRLFLAVDLPSGARHALAAQLAECLGSTLPGKTAPPENWHLTLRFLGNVDPTRYDRLLMELDRTDLGRPFDVSFDGLGAFPRPDRATVLWVGVDDGAPALGDLAGSIEGAVGAAGFDGEERPFRAHLTLSRLRPPEDVSNLISATEAVRVRFRVLEVVVFRSHLGHGRPKYETLERFELVSSRPAEY